MSVGFLPLLLQLGLIHARALDQRVKLGLGSGGGLLGHSGNGCHISVLDPDDDNDDDDDDDDYERSALQRTRSLPALLSFRRHNHFRELPESGEHAGHIPGLHVELVVVVSEGEHPELAVLELLPGLEDVGDKEGEASVIVQPPGDTEGNDDDDDDEEDDDDDDDDDEDDDDDDDDDDAEISYQTSIFPLLSLAWNCWMLAITLLSRRFPSEPLGQTVTALAFLVLVGSTLMFFFVFVFWFAYFFVFLSLLCTIVFCNVNSHL